VLVIEPAARFAPVPRGRISAAGGAAAIAALETAFRLVREGHARGIVTGPLNKAAIHAAGHDVPGHTEWLARACGLPDDAASMMLWLPPSGGCPHGLGVVHATLHEALRGAVGRLSTADIVAAGLRLSRVLPALLGRPPHVAVAALNPHGGEGGLFGDEEARLVVPAVQALAARGLAVAGPLPADTLFLQASQGRFDGVVALYHDQGHIPVKLLGMHRAVNITLGLPLVRTSVAHGTAFDIVGTGAADPASLLAAIDVARRLALAPTAVTAVAEPVP
jgi:4-hydroxythreonine-4-phosphate dehydrogenase